MALDATGRTRVWAHVMRAFPSSLLPFPNVTKQQLKEAVDATDDWIDANSASYNAALPTAFRNAATLPQKTWLFCLVAMRRAGILRVDED